jgi:SAM-dependent methyltransferase
MKLNLGCGNSQRVGYVNVDFYSPYADVQLDLFKLPWPWDDSSADEICAEHFLEHSTDLLFTIKEIHRILKPGGLFHVIVPHARSIHAHSLGHEQMFTYATFAQLCHDDEWYSQAHNVLFREVSFKASLLKMRKLKWTPLDYFASKYPMLWEKLAFGALTPTELEWKGMAVKNKFYG